MMRSELNAAVRVMKEETRNALQTMYDAMNHGQQMKIVKNETVKTLFDRYGVEYGT